jgi:hypothetical protein
MQDVVAEMHAPDHRRPRESGDDGVFACATGMSERNNVLQFHT